jgi:hypothetical protein
MIFGAVYGFVLTWGPLLWGLIAMGSGFVLGLIIKLYTIKKYAKRKKEYKLSELVLIIECNLDQMDMIENILWSHSALGVSKLDL